MQAFNSYRPLCKVKIVTENCSMRSGQQDGTWGSAKSTTIYKAYQYALCDGIEQLDTRIETMFDLSESKLRQRCQREGFSIVN